MNGREIKNSTPPPLDAEDRIQVALGTKKVCVDCGRVVRYVDADGECYYCIMRGLVHKRKWEEYGYYEYP